MSAGDDSTFGDDAVLVRLLEQARAGDAQAEEELFRRLYPYLLLCARGELDSELRGQVRESDVVQQSCLEAHRDLRNFAAGDVPDFVQWMEAILRANVADLRRRMAARKRHGQDEVSLDDSQSSKIQTLKENLKDPKPSAAPSGIMGSSSKDLELDQALEKLPEDYRTVILLRHRDKLSFAEIGEQTGRSMDAARMLWTRAVKRLQGELSGEPGDEE
jgi:RNA polymerase sigma-70 factor (ECF subfamily)